MSNQQKLLLRQINLSAERNNLLINLIEFKFDQNYIRWREQISSLELTCINRRVYRPNIVILHSSNSFNVGFFIIHLPWSSSGPVSWFWILRLVWKKSSNSSNFSDFPSNVGIVVVSDFGNLEILLILLLKFAELFLFANCWRANTFWSPSIVARVFSLRNCGWLVERSFFCFPEDVLEEHKWLPRELLSPCRGHLLGQSFASSGCGRCLLQDENHSGRRPHSFPGLCQMRSGTFPERFRSSPELADSWGSRQDVITRLICGFWTYWTPETTFFRPFPQFLQKLELCSLLVIWEHSSVLPYCS